MLNRKLVLAARPEGLIKSTDFSLVQEEIPNLQEGQILIKTHFLSLAPVMKFYMLDGAGIENKLEFGDTMRGRGTGEVIQSKHPNFKEGDWVNGKFGWQEYVISHAKDYDMLYKIKDKNLPSSTSLGVLGVTGYTSYFGLYEVGGLKENDQVLVSSAAGGVGSLIGALAKIKGAKTIGLTSSDEKKQFLLSEMAYDHAINYKTEDVSSRISEIFPDGIDLYFDNVGGAILDIALSKLRQYARVVCCGRISTYKDNLKIQDYALKNWHMISAKRAKMHGFFIYDYKHRFLEAERDMRQWIAEGKLHYKEDVLHGLEKMPEALNRLFEGKNIGKQLVKIS